MPNTTRLSGVDLHPRVNNLNQPGELSSKFQRLLSSALTSGADVALLGAVLEPLLDAVAEKAAAKAASSVREYLSTEEAAAYTGYSPEWFEQRRVKGDGPPFLRVPGGRLIKYARHQLDAWMLSHQCHHTAAYREGV